MAKKGGVQQLQLDISTDEDFEKFLERQGLLVLDVYSEWCGPCLGMVGSLRKIKLEFGGDNLQLAICKSDTITLLKRFNKKSEPTWLFVTNGKAVNLMFGTDVPKLVALITKELGMVLSKASRPTYNIDELQPVEVEQLRIKTEAIEKEERIVREAKEKKRVDYLKQVTDIIMENMHDIGITIFGPHVNRDMFKKLNEPAEALKMQCKDRKAITVSKADFETINFACNNPLTADVIEQLDGKELLMCFWKVDESLGTVPNVLMTYAHELTKEQTAPPDDIFEEEHVVPPIISPLKLKVEIEIEEGEEWEDEESTDEKIAPVKARGKSQTAIQDSASVMIEVVDDSEGEEEGEEEEIAEADQGAMPPDMSFQMFEIDMDDVDGEEEEVVEVIEEAPKKLTRLKRVKLPAVWVPNNRRTHAACIYVFFRGQTTGFLPPDPKPEPPHVVMAFDAYKRRDLIHVADRHKDDVPLYGFFRSDDPDNAEFIANSMEKYNEVSHTPNDKIVLKVNKVQSNTMLSLVSYGPSYVSPNVDVGHEEALRFFPETYKSAQQERAERLQEEAEKPKKKKKSGVADDAVAELAEEDMPKEEPVEEQQVVEMAETTAEGEVAVPAEGAEPTTEGGEVPAEGAAPPTDTAAEGAAEGAPPPAEGAPAEEAPAAQPEGEAQAAPPAETAPQPAAEAEAPPAEAPQEAPAAETPPPPEPEAAAAEAPAAEAPAAEPPAE